MSDQASVLNSDSSEEPSAVSPERWATAYHEAGHAVMALMLGRNVHRVSIVPKQTRLGACELRKDVARITKDPLEADALVLLAGMVGESRHTGKYQPQAASSDLRQVQQLAAMRSGNPDAAPRQVRRWLDKTEHLLDQPENALAIRMIAQQLIEREKISGRNAAHHYQQAIIRIEKGK